MEIGLLSIKIAFITAFLVTNSSGKGLTFRRLNEELRALNAASAKVAWIVSAGEDGAEEAAKESALLAERKLEWKEGWCGSFNAWNGGAVGMGVSPGAEGWRRMVYLLCRGARYTADEVRNLSLTLGTLRDIYVSARLCLSTRCFRGEPDLERLVRATRQPKTLLWAWEGWRRAVGPPALRIYPQVISLQNSGARRNGYSDAGETWQESDFEAKGLEGLMEDLYQEVLPLYKMLHALVRARLIQHYGEGKHGLSWDGTIPAHLLGNLWAQNWDSLLAIVLGKSFEGSIVKIDETLKARNVTVGGMVHLAEDFYASLGFPRMSQSFWKDSLFTPTHPSTSCHGTAANMFNHSDYRILLCAEVSEEDFFIIHHEMGHIQYFMAYQNQPAIFQDGASPAFQEAVGDAISLAAITPQHLQRISLIKDWTLGRMDIALLLKQALSKLPQLSFSLIVDKWRWAVFGGKVSPKEYNDAWWLLRTEYQGIKAPLPENTDDFDPAAKFHVVDNTPYARYFLGGILQMQIFESLCNAAVSVSQQSSDYNSLPLHRCDIYGSREAGKKLRRVMSLGSSKPWPHAMKYLTGGTTYNTTSLLQYFKPLYHWLEEVIKKENIPVGWN